MCAAAIVRLIRKVWLAAFSIAAVLQVILWPGVENSICVGLAWISCMATGLMLLRSRVTFLYPWSSLMVLMFCLTTCGLPLVLMLFQGDPLTADLEVPVATFRHLLICQIMLLLIHPSYRNVKIWRQIQNGFRRKVLRPFGLLEIPGWSETLALGAAGLAASAYTYIVLWEQSGGVRTITGSVMDKFVQGLIPLSFAPFFLLLPLAASQARKGILFRLGNHSHSRIHRIYDQLHPAATVAMAGGLRCGVLGSPVCDPDIVRQQHQCAPATKDSC